jgi:hypothetical protein
LPAFGHTRIGSTAALGVPKRRSQYWNVAYAKPCSRQYAAADNPLARHPATRSPQTAALSVIAAPSRQKRDCSYSSRGFTGGVGGRLRKNQTRIQGAAITDDQHVVTKGR